MAYRCSGGSSGLTVSMRRWRRPSSWSVLKARTRFPWGGSAAGFSGHSAFRSLGPSGLTQLSAGMGKAGSKSFPLPGCPGYSSTAHDQRRHVKKTELQVLAAGPHHHSCYRGRRSGMVTITCPFQVLPGDGAATDWPGAATESKFPWNDRIASRRRGRLVSPLTRRRMATCDQVPRYQGRTCSRTSKEQLCLPPPLPVPTSRFYSGTLNIARGAPLARLVVSKGGETD